MWAERNYDAVKTSALIVAHGAHVHRVRFVGFHATIAAMAGSATKAMVTGSAIKVVCDVIPNSRFAIETETSNAVINYLQHVGVNAIRVS